MIGEVQKNKPDSPTPQRLLEILIDSEGNFDSSLEAYSKAMDLVEDKKAVLYSTLYLISGHVYLFKNEFEKQENYYQKSIEIRTTIF